MSTYRYPGDHSVGTYLHNDNDLVWLYVQMAWDNTLPSYTNQNIEQYAIKDIDGNPQSFLTLVYIDPYLQFWQDFTRDWNVDYTDDLNVDGIYWDFWSGKNKADYDENHGHPVGGGNYVVQGKQIQAQVTRDAVQQLSGHDEWFLGSEYVNEFFVDTNEIEMWNDDSWDIQKMPKIRLPMYEVAFGDRQYVWGLVQTNPVLEPGWDNQECYTRAARMSVGLLLGFSGDYNDPFDPAASTHGHEAFQFLGTLLRSYEYTRPYLMHGEMMRNIHVNSVGSVPYASIVPHSFYEYGHNWMYTPSYPEVSLILTSVWRSYGQKGRKSIGIVLINWYESQQSINYTVKFDDYGLKKDHSYRLMELDDTGLHLIALHNDDFTREDTLDERSIKVLVIKPNLESQKLPNLHSNLIDGSDVQQRLPIFTR